MNECCKGVQDNSNWIQSNKNEKQTLDYIWFAWLGLITTGPHWLNKIIFSFILYIWNPTIEMTTC